jgi:hypothetical protein
VLVALPAGDVRAGLAETAASDVNRLHEIDQSLAVLATKLDDLE